MLRRGLSRAAQRAAKTVAFFASPKAASGRGAITELTGAEGSGGHMSYVEWELPRGRQWIHVRQQTGLLPTVADYERVTVVSGSCLFNASSARFLPRSGVTGSRLLSPHVVALDRPVHGIAVDERLTLYEYELEVRLTRAITDIVELIPRECEVRVVLDVPQVQYYLRVLDGFADGLIPREVVLGWFDLVDARRSYVIKRLRRRLAANGLSHAADVSSANILDPLAESIREAVRDGRPLGLSRLAEAPELVSWPLWRWLLEGRPLSRFDDLAHLSYAAEVLRAGVHLADEPAALGLLVDSPSEHKILASAQSLAKVVMQARTGVSCSLLGLYCLERLMVARDGRRVALYLGDPGRRLIDEEGASIDGFRLVDELYAEGGRVPNNLQAA